MRPSVVSAVVCVASVTAHAAAMQSAPPRDVARVVEGIVTLRTPPSPMVLLRGGTITMGSTIPEVAVAQAMCRLEPSAGACSSDVFVEELPAHRVTLSDFWIDRAEVSSGAYRRCVEVGACSAPSTVGQARWRARDDWPVTLVTYDDAVRYCRWRGARLPTEAEWERAARGWSGRTYPWGNVYNRTIVNHGRMALVPYDDSDGYLELAPTNSLVQGRTPEGIANLGGNVEEWVADWYGSYGEQPQIDPRGPAIGDFRVVRGGSFRLGRAWTRGAARRKAIPTLAEPWRGFRCARDKA